MRAPDSIINATKGKEVAQGQTCTVSEISRARNFLFVLDASERDEL